MPDDSKPRPPSTDEADFPHWRRNATIIPVSAFLNALGFSMVWPFIPLMLRDLGIEGHLETWTGNMMLVFYLVGFVVNPIWGGLADHYGRKLMVLRATFGMGFSMLIVSTATSPLMFAAMLMLIGLFNGAQSAFSTLLVATTPLHRTGRALTLAQSGNLVGRVLGPAAAAFAAAFVSQYHLMFRVSGAVLVAAGFLSIFARDVQRTVSGRWRLHWLGDLRALLAVPRIGPVLVLCVISSTLWAGNVAIITIFALQLLAEHPPAFGSEAAWVSALPIGLSIASLLALPFWGRLADRISPARTVSYAFAAAIVTHLPLIFLQTPVQLIACRIAFGFLAIAMEPALVRLLKENAPAGMEARAISYGQSFQFLAMGLAPFLAGIIGPIFGLRTYFALLVLLTAAGLGVWLWTGRRR